MDYMKILAVVIPSMLAVNVCLMTLSKLLDEIKDKTENNLDNRLDAMLDKLLPWVQKLVSLLGAIKR